MPDRERYLPVHPVRGGVMANNLSRALALSIVQCVALKTLNVIDLLLHTQQNNA
jgi:hypothetical protein